MVSGTPSRKSFSLILNLAPSAKHSRSSKDLDSSVKSPAFEFFSRSPTSISSPHSSTFSSPLSPLLPSPTHQEPSPELSSVPVPPTTNDLDPSEKMKFLRKTRKLSRILGELLVPVSVDVDSDQPADICLPDILEDSLTSASTSADSSPAKSPPGITRKRSLKRAATIAHATSLAPPPSLTIPPASPLPKSSPVSPIIFACPDADIDPAARSAAHAPSDTKRNSTSSSVLLAEQNPEHVQRTRAAKLVRHLGDTLPPTCSSEPCHLRPAPRSPKTELFAAPHAGCHTRPTAATQSRHPQFSRAADPDSSFLTETAKQKVTLKKNRTTMRHPREANADDDWDEGAPHREPMSERQRSMNVRRARKMAQVFGDEPPHALFQITNIPASPADDARSLTPSAISEGKRDSRGTFVSLAPSTLSVAVAGVGTPNRQLRDSFLTTTSMSESRSSMEAESYHQSLSRYRNPNPHASPRLSPSHHYPPRTPRRDRPETEHPVALARIHHFAHPLRRDLAHLPLAAQHRVHVQAQATPEASTPTAPRPPRAPRPHSPPSLPGPIRSYLLLLPRSIPSRPLRPELPHAPAARREALALLWCCTARPRGRAPVRGHSRRLPTSPVTSSEPPISPMSASGSGLGSPIEATGSRKRTQSSDTSSSASPTQAQPPRPRRRPQTTERTSGEAEAEGHQTHSRGYSTTVEVCAEVKSPFGFLDGLRPGQGTSAKEMDMRDVIKQLRKIK
ncbi:hypothetical protein A0H81_00691 [Grifola frondosa]|uniref:Uncharacterized protein n=1 Tax=Grifola frondosa TaxID=5627 RepID=A0A1C7MTG6_GRIFR|nr:hypothetical protein A0H81_00691 [Grifola frondosa]